MSGAGGEARRALLGYSMLGTIAANDRDERRSARDNALRAGEDMLPHPQDCLCHECAAEGARGEVQR